MYSVDPTLVRDAMNYANSGDTRSAWYLVGYTEGRSGRNPDPPSYYEYMYDQGYEDGKGDSELP